MENAFKLLLILSLIGSIQTYGQNREKWKFQTGGPIHGSATVDDKLLYIGSSDSCLYALDKESGVPIWKYKTAGPIHSTPAISDDQIYFASFDSHLYCLNQEGEEKWKFRSAGEKKYDLWDYYMSSPLVVNDIVYWGSSDSSLYAINTKSGELMWKFTSEGMIHATPVYAEGSIYVGSFDGNFYSLDAKNGSLNWKFDTIGDRYFPKGEIQKGATVSGNTICFGSRDYNIYCLNAETGKGIWNFKEPSGWIIAEPLIEAQNIYFGTSDGHKFYCVDLSNGKTNWVLPLNMRVYGQAIQKDATIYFGTFDGKLLAVNKTDGAVEWEYQTEASKDNYAKLYDENGNFIEGFDLYGNNMVANEKLILSLGSILSSPTITGNKIFFGSTDGNVYCLDLE